MRKAPCFSKSLSTITDTSLSLIKINCQLATLTRSGEYEPALHLFTEVHRRETLNPDQYTVSTALTAAARLRDAIFGCQIHSHAIKSGLLSHSHVHNTLLSLHGKTNDLVSLEKVFNEITDPDVYSWTTLLNACVKLGDISYAYKVFDEMPNRDDVAVWNAMITGCMENGCEEMGVGLFKEMHKLGVRHDNYSFASVLSSCSCEFVDFGKQVHSLAIKTGSLVKPSVVNALIKMYFNRKDLLAAFQAFEEAGNFVHDEITFNVMIDGLVDSGKETEAVSMIKAMLDAGFRPTDLTFVSLMSSCSCEATGHQIHALTIKAGFEFFTSASNSAMKMYSAFGDLKGVSRVFNSLVEKDLVSWNTMISSYAQGGLNESAVLVFKEMQKVGLEADEFTFGSLLVSSECLETVEMIQSSVHKHGLISKVEVSNALVSAYSKHGKIERAFQVFHNSQKNIISWNTILSGFLQNGFPLQGLEKFAKLLESEIKPNSYTFGILLSICTDISSLSLGKQIHGCILRQGHFPNKSLENILITLYAKCGLLLWSLRVFDEISKKDVISWNAVISAYAQHGKGEEAVLAFEAMEKASSGNIRPDNATFTAVLSACSHTGMINKGVQMFHKMVRNYGYNPGRDHISCVVDLLARAGNLDEAVNLVANGAGVDESSDAWWVLFGACAAHGDLRLGRRVAEILVGREKDNPSVYVLLSNIYASAGQWEEAETVRNSMMGIGATKERGCSWIRS